MRDGRPTTRRTVTGIVLVAVVVAAALAGPGRPMARADAAPATVTVAGSFQSEAGCSGDWDPGCAATHLTRQGASAVWAGAFSVPAGSYEYKFAIDDSWNENYGAGGVAGGANIALVLSTPRVVRFTYDESTHRVQQDTAGVLATVAGSFQSEVGCPGDWSPDCLATFLADPEGDATSSLTVVLPPGGYEAKVAIGLSWDENYGAGGVRNGANIAFTVPADATRTTFTYGEASHVLTVTSTGPPKVVPGAATIAEGDSGTRTIAVPVTLSRPSYFTVTARWTTVDQTAKAPGDYVAASGTVTFSPGQTAKTVGITVKGDVLEEADESFLVAFSQPTGAVIGGFYGLGSATIRNDDFAVVIPGASAVGETDAGLHAQQIPVLLSRGSFYPITVRWTTVDSTAKAPGDYVAASGTLTFAPGQTSASVTVQVRGDTLAEADEVFLVRFSQPSNATIGGFYGLGVGTVVDDD